MKKTFVIQVEYPDCDTITSDELIEVTKESFEYLLSRYFGANIMDGDYDRIKVKEVTDFISLVRRMRETQKKIKGYSPTRIEKDRCQWENDLDNKAYLESEVDEYLKKMEDGLAGDR